MTKILIVFVLLTTSALSSPINNQETVEGAQPKSTQQELSPSSNDQSLSTSNKISDQVKLNENHLDTAATIADNADTADNVQNKANNKSDGEMMETAQTIIFRPLFAYRQLVAKRNRINAERRNYNNNDNNYYYPNRPSGNCNGNNGYNGYNGYGDSYYY